MSTGLKANSDGSAAIQVGGTDVITLTSGGAATFVTSPTTVQAGTAAAPSITFSGDTNTGIYSPGADTIAFTEGGVESMRLNSSGNMGLGVTPSAWRSNYKAIQFNGTGALWGAGGGFDFLSSNVYVDSSDNLRYLGTAPAAYYRLNNANGQHIWYSAPSGTAGNLATMTQVLAVERANTLALEGAVSQSGTGITFPATQSASSNANTLDDYEEGTWTPAVRGGTTAGTTTHTVQNGRYTKIGRVVTVTFEVAISAMTGTGALLVGGLPFASSATNSVAIGALLTDQLDWPNTMTSVVSTSTLNSTDVRFWGCVDNGVFSQFAVENATWSIYSSLTYMVD